MSRSKGFTLVEVLVSVFIFIVVVMAVYEAYTSLWVTISTSHVNVLASDLVNEKFEIIRNLPYADVGVAGSVPTGKLARTQTITRDKIDFVVTTTVRNTDNPFDGTIGGVPNDLSPADYKFVEVEVSCQTCKSFKPVLVTSIIAPKNLETASTNGALFVQVFDANGYPITGANVHIFNASTTPTLTIDDTTNNTGYLRIVDAPPAASSYEITATKSGYSTDRTYKVGGAGNPDPSKPHATVALQNVTQISFAIDRTSTLNVSSVDKTCATVPNFPFTVKGTKLIGLPSVYKYDENLLTDGSGNKIINNLEWDTYSFNTSSSLYEIRGLNPMTPLQILPNSTKNLQFVVAPQNPNTLLVSVTDSVTNQPISGAAVSLNGNILYTGRGSLTQTDWSGGAGQATSSDLTAYQSGTNIAGNSPPGDLTLNQVLGDYSLSGTLTSSAFDTGATSTFQELIWNPVAQPPAAGADSLKFQFASNNDGGVWNFVGPDGTSGSYYTTADRDLSPIHTSSRYDKYKAFLSTATTTTTPNLSDLSFTFTSSCLPPGQVTYSGYSSGNYPITISKNGFVTYNGTVSLTLPWQMLSISLDPL